jgi:subtilisin family serine protease
MIADGSGEVNATRSEQCAALVVKKTEPEHPPLRGAEPVHAKEVPPEPPPLQELAENVLVNVFIEMQDPGEDSITVARDQARRGNIVTATIPLTNLPRIAKDPHVLHIEMGDPIASPTPTVSRHQVQEPRIDRWQFGNPEKHRNGEGVLIGIIDVQGFDFAHPDFLQDGKTRFARIWDMGGNVRPSPYMQNNRYGRQFDFGAEFRQEHLNQALESAAALRVPPQEIERQSQMVLSSHATHVASIAAGNHGVASRATIAGVLISLPEEDQDRRKSFYDSTRIALAVDYLLFLAEELKMPVCINISLGTNGQAHDGTDSISRWIDNALSAPGRCVTVAAGNAGQEVSTFAGDIGFVLGRIHTYGKIPGRYLHKDIEWEVIGNGIVDISENELEIWYEAPDRLAVSVLPPLPGADWIGPVEPRSYIQNHQLQDGSFLSIYNELYYPTNGCNYIAIYLSPFLGTDSIKGVSAGTWRVRLYGRDVRNGTYHGWIERDDPHRLGQLGPREAWRFPSFFSETSNVDNTSVSSLACGRRVISVANLHEEQERVHITSSQGPTRDNRYKPDVAAPGTDIVAANGFSQGNALWVKMTGTSMASPFTAGVIGLMLAVEPKLTAAQIEGILHRTSRPLLGRPYAWADDMGFGQINPEGCLQEAEAINERWEVLL